MSEESSTPEAASAPPRRPVVIGMLGTGTPGSSGYAEVNYHFADAAPAAGVSSEYVQEALLTLLGAERYEALVTAEARNVHGALLTERLQDRFRDNPIPTQQGIDDLWQVFETVARAAPRDGSPVILDVTHGIRTHPMLLLAAALYLKEALNVDVTRIVYGQWIKGQTDAPIADLTPFLDLLGWTRAVQELNSAGRGERFREMVRRSGDPTVTRLGGAVAALCQALQLNRTLRAVVSAHNLLQALDAVDPASLTGAAGPIAPLLDGIRTTFAPLAAADPLSDAGLRAQAAMIAWYLERRLYLQASALMSEWIVTFHCRNAQYDPNLYADREAVSSALNEAAHAYSIVLKRTGMKQNAMTAASDGARARGYTATLAQPLLTMWRDVQNLRNDLMHCGFRDNAMTPRNAVEGVKERAARFHSAVDAALGSRE